MVRGAWWAIFHWVTKELDMTYRLKTTSGFTNSQQEKTFDTE